MIKYADMTEDQRRVFLDMAFSVISNMRSTASSSLPSEARPAFVAMWVMAYQRSDRNLWTQFDIDRKAFVDEALTLGVRFFENLSAFMRDKPPPGHFTKSDVDKLIQGSDQGIVVLQHPGYRAIIEVTYEDYFRVQRERGKL